MTRATLKRGPCPRCHYIGNRHLCGCIAAVREALSDGKPDEALRLLNELVAAANAEERRIEVIPCSHTAQEASTRRSITIPFLGRRSNA